MNTSGDLRNLILGKKCMESVFPSYMQIDSNLLQNSVMVEPTRTAGKLSLWKMVNFNKGPRGIRENVLVFMQPCFPLAKYSLFNCLQRNTENFE